MKKIIVWFKRNWYFLLFLLILVGITYINSINNTFISDDVDSIVNNPVIGDVHTLIPKTVLSTQVFLHFIAFKIGGLNPAPFRLINLTFHLGAVFFIFAIIAVLTNRTLAFFAAALFAVHPLATESVTWISGGNYVTYSFFFLVSLFCYIQAKQDRRYYFFSIIFFALSLFSSEKAVSLPLVFILYEWTYRRKERFLQTSLKRVMPFLLITLATATIFLMRISEQLLVVRQVHYAQEKLYSYNSILQVPLAITKYLQLIFFPVTMSLYHTEIYSYAQVMVRIIFSVVFFAIIALSYRRSKFTFFWLSFFLIALLPTIIPLNVASSIAERYVYLGTIGIVTVFAFFLYKLYRVPKYQTLALVFFVSVVTLLSARTIVRNSDWKSYESFWLSTVKTSPESYQAHNNAGIIYAKRGDLKLAIEEFEKSASIVPNLPQNYMNLGILYAAIGNNKYAIAYFEKALQLDPTNQQIKQALEKLKN